MGSQYGIPEIYESPSVHHGEFEGLEHDHESYLMNRLSAMHNNKEELKRNVSELQKMKKKRKIKRKDSSKSRKSSVMYKTSRMGGLKRITNVLRGITLKKEEST